MEMLVLTWKMVVSWERLKRDSNSGDRVIIIISCCFTTIIIVSMVVYK